MGDFLVVEVGYLISAQDLPHAFGLCSRAASYFARMGEAICMCKRTHRHKVLESPHAPIHGVCSDTTHRRAADVLLLCLQTKVQVNIRTFKIQLFEVVDIVANSCPGSNSCFGNACSSSACGDLQCPAVTAQVRLP